MSPGSDRLRHTQILRSLLEGHAMIVRNAMQSDWPAHRGGNLKSRPLFWVERVDADVMLECGDLVVTENGLAVAPAIRRRLKGLPALETTEPEKSNPADKDAPAPRKAAPASRGSTIVQLSRRRDQTRTPMLTERQVATAERFARDGIRAGEGGPGRSDPSAPHVDGTRRHDSAERAMIARIDAGRAINAARAAVGPDMARLLDYVCVGNRKLAAVETEEGWPAGMALHMLRMALDRLAIHYAALPNARSPTHRSSDPSHQTRYFRQ